MKSATTHLQNLCDVNSAALADAGILWPGSRPIFSSTASSAWPPSEAWRAISNEINEYDGPALISNELLSLRGKPKLEPFLSTLDTDIQVIITARDLGRVIPSQWHTGTRNRVDAPPWPIFIQSLMDDKPDDPAVSWFWRRQDIPRMIRLWKRLRPEAPITLVTVPPSGSDPQVISQRFMSLLGIDAAGLAPATWRNPDYGLQTSEFSRRLAERLGNLTSTQYREVVPMRISRAIVAEPQPFPPTKIRLTAEQMGWARERARQMVADIADLGVDVVGDLDELIPADDAATGGPVEPASDAELLEIAMRALTAIAEAWPETSQPADAPPADADS